VLLGEHVASVDEDVGALGAHVHAAEEQDDDARVVLDDALEKRRVDGERLWDAWGKRNVNAM